MQHQHTQKPELTHESDSDHNSTKHTHAKRLDAESESLPLYLQRSQTQLLQRQPLEEEEEELQTKLKIGAPNDRYEQEADRVADQVMRMPEPKVQRQPEPEEEEEEAAPELEGEDESTPILDSVPTQDADELGEEEAVQTKSLSHKPAPVKAGLHSRIQSLKGGGQPLPGTERAFFEPRFGADFSHVRIHNDPIAAKVARSINAKAFTKGRDVVFGNGEYAPGSSSGRRLLAHELTHTLQQSGSGAPLVRMRSGTRIAKADLDLNRLDKELTKGKSLTQSQGKIGGGATKGPRMSVPGEDKQGLPITAQVFQRILPAPVPDAKTKQKCRPYGEVDPKCPHEDPGCMQSAVSSYNRCIKREMAAKLKANPPPNPPPAERAVIVSGIHGDERGPLALVKQLQTELGAGKNPLSRDFDTVVIPEMNPWGVANKDRLNQRSVDLNRNFPGLPGAKQPGAKAKIPPEQPEVKAVRNVIQTLKPQRILAMHAMSAHPTTKAARGGVFADPVEGEARELACRMALRMRGVKDEAVPSNLLKTGVCSSRYPSQAAVNVTTKQSSLGTWGSTLKTASGKRTLVITHEVPGKSPLAASGKDRSVDTTMPGLHDFLRDNSKAASEADTLLRKAVRDAFLTGEQSTAQDKALLKSIERIVDERFQDMAVFYKDVWRPRNSTAKPTLPRSLTKSQTRSFGSQARIVKSELKTRGINRKSTASEIEKAIKDILKTMSMPGFSRHHWGTEIDMMAPPVKRADWTKPTGKFTSLIPFLEQEAPKFGFSHPYSSPRPFPGKPQYLDEPWHISYAPVANVLQAEWQKRMSGATLDSLIIRTAQAIRGSITQARMEKILQGLNLASYQSNVAKS